jgi:hypothetical protein
MFHIKVGDQSVVYTGDYNMTPDRHLGAAWIDKCRPDVIITESTYATTIRDSKRCREHNFLKKVHACVENGGKVLIPVFALGRAQELCILLETYWERNNLKVPIYFSAGLTEKANQYYKLFISWTNQKIKKTFVEHNMFEFKHIQPFDRSYVDEPGPQVLFATPGMLHAGLSLFVFKKWAPDPKNMVILPGYCVAGTVGAKVLQGKKNIEIEGGGNIAVNLSVEHLSFSAHADAKGIMQLIQQCDAKNVVLVHGEKKKMGFLSDRIKKELGKPCYFPANGECLDIEVDTPVPIVMSRGLVAKRRREGEPSEDEGLHTKAPRSGVQASAGARAETQAKAVAGVGAGAGAGLGAGVEVGVATGMGTKKKVEGVLVMKDSGPFKLLEPAEAAAELGLGQHNIEFLTTVSVQIAPDVSAGKALEIMQGLLAVDVGEAASELVLHETTLRIRSVQIRYKRARVMEVSWEYADDQLANRIIRVLGASTPGIGQ